MKNKFYISISNTQIEHPVDFDVAETSFSEISNLILNKHYSPTIFKDGYRKNENFTRVEVLVLDIDDGMSIDDVMKKLKGYRAIITTTRTHQKSEKNGKSIIPNDKYRLFLELKEPITDKVIYKLVIIGLITEFNADKQCKDLARFYYCNPEQKVYEIKGDKYWDIDKYLSQTSTITKSLQCNRKSKVSLQADKVILSHEGLKKSVKEWYLTLNNVDKKMVHCPLAPQMHNNGDSTPSCEMSKNNDFLNFNCYGCGSKGYYNNNSKKYDKTAIALQTIDKEEILSKINTENFSLIDVIDLLVKHLPALIESNDKEEDDNKDKEDDDTYFIIENIANNALCPIKSFGETLYIYINGKWDSFSTLEEEKLRLVKPLIEKSIDNKRRVKKKQIEQVTAELKTSFIPLDAYSKRDGVFINMLSDTVKIDEVGSVKRLSHSPDYGFRWKLDFNYNESAICPRFRKFLDEVISDDETIKVIQEFMGYVLIPHKHKNYEKALWTIGNGSNGKSVFNNIIAKLYGEASTSYLNLDEISNDEKRVMLKGKLLNISSDAVNRINSSDFKRIVSGEKIIGRELYKGVTYIDTLPKLLIATNEMPRITSGTDAFLRRVLLITFDKVIKEEDRDIDLEKKLTKEIEGIFNFALEGLKRLLRQDGFTKSKAIEEAVLEFRGELDVLPDFLQSHPLEEDNEKGGSYITQAELYKKLEDWCRDSNRRNSYKSPKQVKDRLVNHHRFKAYKNNTVYGIRARWKSKEVNQIIKEGSLPYGD